MPEGHPTASPDWSRLEGRIGATARDHLAGCRVAIIGLGSLGGTVTVELSKHGVTRFILVDPDKLEPHNVVRHVCDLRDVGRAKAEAVADLVRYRNPEAVIEVILDDGRKAVDRFTEVDLAVVCGLGSEITHRQMGRLLRRAGIRALYSGLHEKAVGGDGFFVDPNSGPCYQCFSSWIGAVEPDNPDRKVDYGLPREEVVAEPGLGIHIARVALVAADWALRILINDPAVLKPYPANLVLLANEGVSFGRRKDTGEPFYVPPTSSRWMRIRKSPECQICGDAAPIQVSSMDELLEQRPEGGQNG